MGDKRICDWNEEKVGCFDKDLRKLDENALEEYRDRLQNSEKFIKQASRHFDQSLPIKTRLQHVEATLRHIYNNIDSISGSSVVPLVPLQHPADDQPFLNTLISENKKDPEKYANLVGLFKLGVPPKNLKLRAKELFSEIDWDEGLEEKSSFSPKKPPTEEELRAKAMKAEKRRLMAQRKREADEELEQRLINIKVNEKGLENFKLEKYLCNICKSRRYYELNEDACRETCSSEIDNKGDAWFWDNDPYPFSKRRRRRK